MFVRKFAQAIATIAMVISAPALAEDVKLQGTVFVEKTVVEDGQETVKLVTPDMVVPGDQLVFTTSYQNEGQLPAENFIVTNPVPEAVIVNDETAADAIVSVDGGQQWGKLASLTVADGQGGTRPATRGDITHLRWTVASIAPGGEGSLEYRAVVR